VPRLTLSEFNLLALSKVQLSTDSDDKKVKTFTLILGVDTEYKSSPNQPAQLLTTQVALSASPEEAFVFEHPTVSNLNFPDFPGRCVPFRHGFIGIDILGLSEAPPTTKTEVKLIFDFLIFYSPTDVFRGLFDDKVTSDRILENCSQNARLKVDIPSKGHSIDTISTGYKVVHPVWGCTELFLKISDFAGVNGKGSLAALTSALGVQRLDDKNAFNQTDKVNMDVTYQTRTEDFLTYGIGDACVLFGIADAVNNRFQNLAGVHALKVSNEAPLTTGSTVNKIFQEYLRTYCGDFKAWTLFPNHKKKPGTFEDLVKEGGIKRLASYAKTSLPSSALVNGGRAKNEKPTTFKASGVICDADISGAYSAQMRQLIYPIGVPTKYATHAGNDHRYTLGSFLKKHEKDFVPGCWQIIVTGKLDFYQDLIPSKVVDPYEIELSESEDDEVNINAPFRIYTCEVINGVIIHDNLQIIRALSAGKEQSGWLNLEVVSAVYYPKSKQHFDPKAWFDAVSSDKAKTGNTGVCTTSSKGFTITDGRSTHWLAVPLDNFIKPYQDARSDLKAKLKQCTKGSEEYFKYDALQTSFKLVINTLYGVIATDKLPSGNAVCANNITGGIRAFTWLLKVSLGSLQSITDGGAYDANRVNFRSDKPSFNTIAKLRNPQLLTQKSRFNIKTKPLGGSPWTLEQGCDSNWSILKSETVSWTIKSGVLPDLDLLALEHVKDFFRDCEIDLLSYQKIEHKYAFVGISTHSQTDYSFKDVWGQTSYKSRGKKTSGKRYEGGEDSNKVNFLDDLREGFAVTKYATQLIGEQVKVNKAKQFRTSKTESVFTRNGLTAGDVILKSSSISIFSLSQFFYQTNSQYESWEKGVEKLKLESEQGLEQFFKNEDGSVNYQLLVDTVQSKLDSGETWSKTGFWRD
jgi:hypothetical protein